MSEKKQCPKCNDTLVVKEGMFGSRLTGLMSGLVCEKCNALYDNPDDSFIEKHTSLCNREEK